MRVFVIGVGGVGSWLTPALCLLIKPESVIVMDGDKLEDKNLNRQLFDTSDIGSFKAVALARKYGCEFQNEWFAFGGQPYESDDVLMCCVDNNAGRIAVLDACDYHKCNSIFAANEVHSSEAYAYLPHWNGSNLDPRIMYPEMVADTAGDPRRAAIGCTGEAQANNVQLVSANMLAASLALHLFVVWQMEARKLKRDVWPHLPHKLVQTLSRSESFKATINQKDTL